MAGHGKRDAMDSQENDPFAPLKTKPTATRPLLGLTVLVIEDSRFACEAMRLLCLRSGARIRRADSMRSARRHLQVYRPSIAIIDLGLPDGDGSELISELSQGTPRPDVILGLSGDPDNETNAMAAGADGFLEKPISSLAIFQELVLSHLPEGQRPDVLRALPKDEDVEPDPIAFQDDMAHAADMLDTREDDKALDYVAQFLGGVARLAKDDDLLSAASDLASKRAQGVAASSELAKVAGLVRERLNQRMAI